MIGGTKGGCVRGEVDAVLVRQLSLQSGPRSVDGSMSDLRSVSGHRDSTGYTSQISQKRPWKFRRLRRFPLLNER